jgi:hypothetical protein
MIKTNLKEIFNFFQQKDIFIEKIKIDGEFFSVNQLKVIYNTVHDKALFDCIELDFKYFLSRRKALIVLLEEDYFNSSMYDFNDLNPYENKANIRFKIRHNSKKDLDTPEKVHPKNPCVYFKSDEMAYSKRHYKEALEDILTTPFHFFEVEEAAEALQKTYDKMIKNDC